MIHCILLLLGAGLFWGGVGIWDIIEFFNRRRVNSPMPASGIA